jgi:ABC-type hemin transport system ATPase subunit
VLTGVNLAVDAGARLALVGANGAVRALAGLDPVLGGSILWDGGPLPKGSARVRMLGVLFQTEAPSRFTVRELLTLGLGLDGPASSSHRARVTEALERAELMPRGETAVVLATHDLALAATCDRVALLDRGRLALIGRAGEVLTPENLQRALGAKVRRLDDPSGGPPLFRVAIQ